jgi:hypothetical protein
MTIDVLAYNALNAEIKPLRTFVAAQQTCITNTNSSISAVQGTISQVQCCCAALEATVASNAVNIVANAGPNQAHLWCLIPEGTGWTGGFKVCDTSGNFRCSNTCNWTVPGGVTCARFQLWGAGAGTGNPATCGGSPYGGTGAYASVIMPVTAGCVYCITSGCAFCCFACCGCGNTASGCPSFIIGPGLTNFCAEGGEGNRFCEAVTRGLIGAVAGNCTYFGSLCNSGSEWCWNYRQNASFNACFDNIQPMISSCKTFFGTATGGTVYGIRGSFGYVSVVCNNSMCVAHPPIYGFGASSCCNCCISVNYRMGCCRGAAQGFMQIPGAGGFASFKCSSTTTSAGDSGRMGMVCVSFK